jgi:cytochrome c oxidase subunit IV
MLLGVKMKYSLILLGMIIHSSVKCAVFLCSVYARLHG